MKRIKIVYIERKMRSWGFDSNCIKKVGGFEESTDLADSSDLYYNLFS